MPISVLDFEEKGTEATRTGFGGTMTKDTMALLNSAEGAYSLAEVVEATKTDMSDKRANHSLMNVLYVLRNKTKRIVMKMVDGEKYYVSKVWAGEDAESDEDVDDAELVEDEDIEE